MTRDLPIAAPWPSLSEVLACGRGGTNEGSFSVDMGLLVWFHAIFLSSLSPALRVSYHKKAKYSPRAKTNIILSVALVTKVIVFRRVPNLPPFFFFPHEVKGGGANLSPYPSSVNTGFIPSSRPERREAVIP